VVKIFPVRVTILDSICYCGWHRRQNSSLSGAAAGELAFPEAGADLMRCFLCGLRRSIRGLIRQTDVLNQPGLIFRGSMKDGIESGLNISLCEALVDVATAGSLRFTEGTHRRGGETSIYPENHSRRGCRIAGFVRATRGMQSMRNKNVVCVVTCLILGIYAWIPATSQTADSTVDRAEAKVAPSRVLGPVDDEDFYSITARPVLRHHLLLPSPALADPGQQRLKPKLRVATEARPNAVKTGTGIVYTCASNVPTSTCNYLNTTVAGYYNNIFTNANADIYIQFGVTGLGASDGFINLVHYTPYVSALTNKAVKSSIQASALSGINTYATPAYGTQNIVGISVSLGTALGFTGLIGINAAETASCTPYTSGCYNEVITVANAATQAQEGFSLYYDDQGGTEGPNQYDFYAVVQHETDEVLGTSSCISTQSSSALSDECDGPVTGSNGIPSVVDLSRYSSPAHLALDTSPSTTAGQYFSFDGGVHYGVGGDGNLPKVYNTLDNGDDFADYISSSPDCGTNQAVQDAEGCPGEDAGLTILNDGESEITILNTVGFDIPEAVLTSPAPGSTLSGTSATFTWSAVAGAADYAITVGTTGVGSSDIYASPSGAPATSQAITGLPTSGTIYVRVFSYVGGFWTSIDYTVTGGSGNLIPAISLSPATLTFASTTQGSTSAAQTVTVKNTGSASASLASETLTGAGASSYLISANTCGASLAVNATCAVSIEFKPAATGTFPASLSVADNATGSPQKVTLNGTGTPPLTVSLTPTSLIFAPTAVGATSAAQLVTVKNNTAAAITLTSETITGTNASSFVKGTTTCTASLAASASCTVSITFKPTTTGTLTANLSVADSATGSPQLATLTGTGGSTPSALQFIPVTPCRIVDTRNATGAFGGPELAAGDARTFDVPQSGCGIPANAVAYSLNVTVVPIESLGYLTVWPSGQAQPVVSTLNSDGRVKANATITPAGTNGGVNVYASDATQFILDIDGYFVPAGTTSGLQFFPLTPCRVADTRNATGSLGGPSLAGNDSRAFPVQSSACGIPSTAKAYSLNITAVPHDSLGFLTAWPSGQAQPVVSTLNSSTGVVTANAAIVPAGSGGDISIFVSDAADVILDVDGYFAPPATGGLSLYTVTPCRVLDTRNGAGAFNGTLAVPVHTSTCAPPSTAKSYILNATVVPPASLSYLTLWAAGGSQPEVSTLNATDGAVTSNMAIVPTTNGSIDAFATDSTQLILDISSYFAP
jgi:Abnormal spindle-like microcephaly-assoc'd, ASPM-SPD-2-Hydin